MLSGIIAGASVLAVFYVGFYVYSGFQYVGTSDYKINGVYETSDEIIERTKMKH